MQQKKAKRGFVELMAIALTFILGIILIFNVMLPILNSNLSTVNITASPGPANLTGYNGANGIGGATYIITVLSVLALAAGVVLAFFRGGVGNI